MLSDFFWHCRKPK